MTRDTSVGAVCARTHPQGEGPLYWYQQFEYAIAMHALETKKSYENINTNFSMLSKLNNTLLNRCGKQVHDHIILLRCQV
jgi:hypothetical protein